MTCHIFAIYYDILAILLFYPCVPTQFCIPYFDIGKQTTVTAPPVTTIETVKITPTPDPTPSTVPPDSSSTQTADSFVCYDAIGKISSSGYSAMY
jgi:hypothetical protein